MDIFWLILAIVLALVWGAIANHALATMPSDHLTALRSSLRTSFAIGFANEGDPGERCPVVTIVTEAGPVRINESDYDPNTMTLADDTGAPAPTATTPAPAPTATTPAPAPTAATEMFVSPEGSGNKRKFFVVGADGVKITGEGIIADGYATEADAWSAITAIKLAASAQG